MAELSRRGLLATAGTAVGIGGLVGTPAASAAQVATFVLYGSGLRILGARGENAAGKTRTVRGLLHTVAGGAAVGEFFATGVLLTAHRLMDPELGSFETHLFHTQDGTLTGTGTVHHDGTGSFTVTGGTGRFAAAHGSYTSKQSADHSGTGVAEFSFTIG